MNFKGLEKTILGWVIGAVGATAVHAFPHDAACISLVSTYLAHVLGIGHGLIASNVSSHTTPSA